MLTECQQGRHPRAGVQSPALMELAPVHQGVGLKDALSFGSGSCVCGFHTPDSQVVLTVLHPVVLTLVRLSSDRRRTTSHDPQTHPVPQVGLMIPVCATMYRACLWEYTSVCN